MLQAFAYTRIHAALLNRVSETTELFGNVAHRFSPYGKRGVTDRGPIEVRGAISTQFVRTADGWRISSMAWDDERPGLELPEP